MLKKMEVLAPVGSMESLFAAVRTGADAVYFGAKEFSARRNAENFTAEEMAEAVKYCKKSGVKTYLTLNISIKDNEMDEALRVAENAYNCGIDGLILCDLGLSKIIKNRFPEIEIHASTQFSVNSPSALYFLKEMGFSRVVPAREMSKEELISLCKTAKELDMEVEVFVHGALCMCLSGQCLLSSVLGARSGNRGLCAGPCRLPFSVNGGTGYDLSLKDLSLFGHISELEEMGVCSLKIEGRMKRPEYIACAVSCCRQAVDKGFIDKDLDEASKSVFSRSGFTDGYFTGKIGKEMFGIRTKDDVQKSKEIFGFIHELYRNERQVRPIFAKLFVKENQRIKLETSCDGNTVTLFGEIPQKAQSKAVTKEDLIKPLSQFGGSTYFAENIDIELDGGLFVPVSEIKNLRRQAVEKLDELFMVIPKRRTENYTFEAEERQYEKPKIYAEFLSQNQLPKDLSGIDTIIFPISSLPEKLPENVRIAVSLPRFIFSESQLAKKLKSAKERGINIALCGNLSAVILAQNEGFEIIGDIGLNVFNEKSAKVLSDKNIGEITVSAELSLKNISSLKTVSKKGIFAYGRLPLMCFRNCPNKNGTTCDKCNKNGKITDRLSIEFPIRCRDGYSEMFNSKPIYLADRLDELKNIDYFILSFFDETREEVEKIVAEYNGKGGKTADYTRGLYYKEVL